MRKNFFFFKFFGKKNFSESFFFEKLLEKNVFSENFSSNSNYFLRSCSRSEVFWETKVIKLIKKRLSTKICWKRRCCLRVKKLFEFPLKCFLFFVERRHGKFFSFPWGYWSHKSTEVYTEFTYVAYYEVFLNVVSLLSKTFPQTKNIFRVCGYIQENIYFGALLYHTIWFTTVFPRIFLQKKEYTRFSCQIILINKPFIENHDTRLIFL